VVDGAVSKLVLGPTVLGEWGKEGVKLGLREADNGSGGFFSKLLEVKLGNGMEGFDGKLGSNWGWGADNIGVGINGSGLKGIWVNEGDAGAGRRCRILGGLGDEDIIGARAHGSKEGEAGDNELRTGGNGGRPGDDGRRYRFGGVLKMGASGTWVIPSVVGTVEGVVDNLKGSGGVLLIDSVQVGPGGNGEGR